MKIHSDIWNHGCCCHLLREIADVVLGGTVIITIVRHQLIRQLADRSDGNDDEGTCVLSVSSKRERDEEGKRDALGSGSRGGGKRKSEKERTLREE